MEFFLLLGTLALVGMSLVGLLVYLAGRGLAWIVGRLLKGRPSRDAWKRRSVLATYVLSGVFIFWVAYDAIYPSDSFFLGEFREVVLRDPPASARVLAKSASYPAPNGDYCSFSRIELSRTDFDELLAAIEADPRLSRGAGLGSKERTDVLRSVERIESLASFVRQDHEHPDHYMSIDFLSSRSHLDVGLCYT